MHDQASKTIYNLSLGRATFVQCEGRAHLADGHNCPVSIHPAAATTTTDSVDGMCMRAITPFI
jgi:hypothetical protein